MDPDRWRTLSPLLDHALELDGAKRDAWLAALRRVDSGTADEVESLLREGAALEVSSYLEQGCPEVAERRPDNESTPSEMTDRTFGPYTLERPLGHGGMGAVWLAHRSDGRYEAKVAVKLLNAALIGNAAERRFRREGDVLARLAHPHITRLFDAGVGPGGQPYLVLEIVEGERIDVYCDARNLRVEARLRLFLDVLSAVEHAHANLIVHRDIKPQNILVARDGNVKLLDFGIAKLLEDGSEAGEMTQLTRDGGRLLTPEYAAPEQLLGQPVTTATDVYALGVLLYLLLSGRHPTGDTARPPAELVDAVVKAPPPRLSTTMSSLQPDAAATLATRRGLPPMRLCQRLRGDLDSIVAKALEKNPHHRYASVAAFADDIRRHLAHQPVLARPDSFRYRAVKFAKRNAVPVALSTLAIVAILAGLAGTVVQAQRVAAQRDFALRQLARAAALDDFNGFLLYGIAPSGKAFTARELLTRAEDVVVRSVPDEMRTDMLIALGNEYLSMEDDAAARKLLSQAYQLSRNGGDALTRARAACGLSNALARHDGDRDESLRLFDEAMAALPHEPQYVLARIDCLLNGSDAARSIGEPRLGIARAEAAQALIKELTFPSRAIELRTAIDLAESYRVAGDFRKADAAFASAHERLIGMGRGDTQQAGTLLNNWGVLLSQRGESARAAVMLRKAIEISRADDAGREVSPMLLTNYARVLSDLGQVDEAARYVDRALAEARQVDNEIVTNMALVVDVSIRLARGDADGAERALDEVIPRLRKTLPPNHYAFAYATSERARIAAARHDEPKALELATRAVRQSMESDGGAFMTPIVLLRRAKLELAMGRAIEAEADATEALALQNRVLDPAEPSSQRGRAYLLLAQAQAANGKQDLARATASSALAQLTPTLGADHRDTQLALSVSTPANQSAR